MVAACNFNRTSFFFAEGTGTSTCCIRGISESQVYRFYWFIFMEEGKILMFTIFLYAIKITLDLFVN